MGVPKQRHTKSRRNKRRMHIFLKPLILTHCPKCKKPVKSHTVCWSCGYYKGEEVIDVLAKLTKKERKQREKEMKASEKSASAKSSAGKEEKSLNFENLSKK